MCTALTILTRTKYSWPFLQEADLRDHVQQVKPTWEGKEGVERLRVLYYRACKGPDEGWESAFTAQLKDLRVWLCSQWGEARVKHLEELFGLHKRATPKEEESALLAELAALSLGGGRKKDG